MHAGKNLGAQCSELLENGRSIRPVSVVVHLRSHGFARAENVVFNYWWMNSAWSSKKISTQQRLNVIDHQEAIFPTMRNVRSINPAHRVLAKGEDLVICQ